MTDAAAKLTKKGLKIPGISGYFGKDRNRPMAETDAPRTTERCPTCESTNRVDRNYRPSVCMDPWHTEDAQRTETMTPHEEFETWAKDYRKRNNLIHLIGAWDAWAAGAASWKQRAEQEVADDERRMAGLQKDYEAEHEETKRLRTLLAAAARVIELSYRYKQTVSDEWLAAWANYNKLQEGK